MGAFYTNKLETFMAVKEGCVSEEELIPLPKWTFAKLVAKACCAQARISLKVGQ